MDNNLTDQQVDAKFARIVTDTRDSKVFTKYGMQHGRMTMFDFEIHLLGVLVIGAILALAFWGQDLELEQKCYAIFTIVGAAFIGVLALVFRRFKAGFAIASLGLTLIFAIAGVVAWQQYGLPFIASFS